MFIVVKIKTKYEVHLTSRGRVLMSSGQLDSRAQVNRLIKSVDKLWGGMMDVDVKEGNLN